MKLYMDVKCPHCKITERQAIDIDNTQLWEIITEIPKLRVKCKDCNKMYTVEIIALSKVT